MIITNSQMSYLDAPPVGLQILSDQPTVTVLGLEFAAQENSSHFKIRCVQVLLYVPGGHETEEPTRVLVPG